MNRFFEGLGQVGRGLQDELFPISAEVASTLDDKTVKALKKQAVWNLGLGLLAARDKGAGFGGGLGFALNAAQHDLGQGLGQAYAAKRSAREDERLRLLDERAERRENLYEQNLQRQALNDVTDRATRAVQMQYQRERDIKADQRAGVDDARQAAVAALQMKIGREELHKSRMVNVLGRHLATLRRKGLNDDDPVVASLLSRLDSYGVHAYTPPKPAVDPIEEAMRRAFAQQGGGLGNPARPGQPRRYPPLDGLYNAGP